MRMSDVGGGGGFGATGGGGGGVVARGFELLSAEGLEVEPAVDAEAGAGGGVASACALGTRPAMMRTSSREGPWLTAYGM